jgi:hypothetical protein
MWCRKDPEQESWRRSWGYRDENKDEFWAALQSDYNYLMDSNLIESCKVSYKKRRKLNLLRIVNTTLHLKGNLQVSCQIVLQANSEVSRKL